MSVTPALTAAEAATVRRILHKHLPAGTRVHVFGSRAAGRARPNSDLDLVLDAGAELPLGVIAQLREAFDESVLPWSVDLVDRATVSEAFARIIDESRLSFDLGCQL